MDLLRIEILNPKANQLLEDLADLKLISIKREATDFKQFLTNLRAKSKGKISFDDITAEVEAVRKKRYASKSAISRN